MRKNILCCLGTIVVLSMTACKSDPTKLSNSGAAAVLQEEWKEDARNINLGPVLFRSGNETGPGYTTFSRYPLYRALAHKGLLRLENDQDLTSQFSGWGSFFATTQYGVKRAATVIVTTDGEKVGRVKRQANNQPVSVTFVFGGYRIEEIVSNEAMDINGEKYRVVMGTHVFELNPAFRDVCSEAGENPYRERRFRALLKYDAFNKKWKLQGADVGPRDAEFPSDTVPKALAKLR